MSCESREDIVLEMEVPAAGIKFVSVPLGGGSVISGVASIPASLSHSRDLSHDFSSFVTGNDRLMSRLGPTRPRISSAPASSTCVLVTSHSGHVLMATLTRDINERR